MYGDLIREYREKLGINQGELALRLRTAGLNVTRAAVSHWETGRYPSPLDGIHDIQIFADVLKIDLQQLLNITLQNGIARTHGESARKAAHIVEHLPKAAQELAITQLKVLETFYEQQNNPDLQS